MRALRIAPVLQCPVNGACTDEPVAERARMSKDTHPDLKSHGFIGTAMMWKDFCDKVCTNCGSVSCGEAARNVLQGRYRAGRSWRGNRRTWLRMLDLPTPEAPMTTSLTVRIPRRVHGLVRCGDE